MKIKVLFFAALASDLGVDQLELELSDNASVADALDALSEQYPTLRDMAESLATAVNLEYVREDYRLSDADELALIPPVSGG